MVENKYKDPVYLWFFRADNCGWIFGTLQNSRETVWHSWKGCTENGKLGTGLLHPWWAACRRQRIRAAPTDFGPPQSVCPSLFL